MHGINMAKSLEQQLNAGPDSTVQNPPMVVNQENRQWELEGEVTSKEQIANNMIDSTLSVYTSTPILMPYEGNVLGNKSIASQNIFSVLSRTDQLDGNIKSIKREIIQQMERKLDELKISVVSMIEKSSPYVSYVDAVHYNSSSRMSEPPTVEPNQSTSVSRFVDDEYVDQSKTSIRRSSSETQLKRVFIPDSRENIQRTSKKITSQPVVQCKKDRQQQTSIKI